MTIADGYSRASVLMPQKRNPYALSIVRGASGTLIGRLTGFLVVSKSPSARSDNLIYAYGEVPRALDLALRTTRLTNGVVRTLTVNAERMWAALESGFSQATDLAEYVMQTCQLDYRTAYQVVGIAVRQASRDGLRGVDLDGARLDAAAKEYAGQAARAGRPGPDRGARPAADRGDPTLAGGAAPPVVEAMADDCGREAGSLVERARTRRQGFAGRGGGAAGHGRALRRRDRQGRGGVTASNRAEVRIPDEVSVVNVGLPLFAEAVAQQGRPVVNVDWRIPAGGDPDVVAALRRLFGPHAGVIDTANAEVLRRLDRGAPQLVGVRPASDVIPVLRRGQGPAALRPGDRGRRGSATRCAVRCCAAICAEGWAESADQAGDLLGRGRRQARACQRPRCRGPHGDRDGAQTPSGSSSSQTSGVRGVRADRAGIR